MAKYSWMKLNSPASNSRKVKPGGGDNMELIKESLGEILWPPGQIRGT